MLTFIEAKQAVETHSYIVGTQIKKGLRIFGTVESLIIAPFDGINQHRFLREYKQSRNAEKALQTYSGHLFTVLLVVAPIATQELHTMELDQYLRSHEHKEQLASLS
jgi:hypothetical protein